jgi:hypothetical protein
LTRPGKNGFQGIEKSSLKMSDKMKGLFKKMPDRSVFFSINLFATVIAKFSFE